MSNDQMSLFGFGGTPTTTHADEPATLKRATRTNKTAAATPKEKKSPSAKLVAEPVAGPVMPQDVKWIRASGEWWPVVETFYCGHALFAKFDMRRKPDMTCAVPTCTTPGEHYHTLGCDSPSIVSKEKPVNA